VSIAIVGCWLAMMLALGYRQWPAAPKPVPTNGARPAVGEEWMGVYYKGGKIGYTHHRLVPEEGGYVFSEESLLRLALLDTPQVVRARISGHAAADFALRDVSFELRSGIGALQASGVVGTKEFRLTLRSGADVSEQVLSLNEPLYLPSTLRALLQGEALQPGRTLEALIFDPTSLKHDRARVTVEGYESVPQGKGGEQAWRVREEFRDVVTTAWLDATGGVLREEGPMGLVLVRETFEQALDEGWAADTALDLVAREAVPVARPIEDARHRRALRVRLSGIAVDRIPSDSEQVRDGAVLTITRAEIAGLESYSLPYAGGDHAEELAPTAFLQSAHPRVREAARAALGGERDARRAAARLNTFVHEYLRKLPTISIPNALQVLDMREGDCNEHAVLLAALGRAVGLPSRVVAGAVYLDGVFLYHAWCEVWLGQWVSIDPALHQFPADATHLKLVVGGPDEHVALLGVIGRLGVEVLDDDAGPRG
jgi:hypothetical protein